MSSPPPLPPPGHSPFSGDLTPLEQEVLNEYESLLKNLYRMAQSIKDLSDTASGDDVMESLRQLERKSALVCTLLKASVYSLYLMEQLPGQEDGAGDGMGEMEAEQTMMIRGYGQ